jgi:hypothetical protein
MYPTNSTREFIKKNDKELRSMVSYIKSFNSFDGSIDDIVQDFYYKSLSDNIIESYNPNFCRGNSKNPKISTYLFTIIKNMINTERKKSENKIRKNNVNNVKSNDPSYDENDLEISLRMNKVALDYEGIFYQNDDSDLKIELKDFEEKFLKSKFNKVYKLNRRKNKGIKTKGISLLDIYHHLKEGMSSRDISKKYGVSDMFICLLKKELAKNLIRNGFKYKW